MKRRFLLLLLGGLLLVSFARAEFYSGAPAKEDVPVFSDPFALVAHALVKAYQGGRQDSPVHPASGVCPFHPTCSRYALQSLVAYGAFPAALLVVDRLLFREANPDPALYAVGVFDEGARLLDPVASSKPFVPAFARAFRAESASPPGTRFLAYVFPTEEP